jgi:5-methylcytosine-specific restriction endonuclease McrA
VSFNLKVGEIKKAYLTEQEIWKIINQFFANGHFTTTYKYGLMKALIENLYNVDNRLVLTFDQVYFSFAKIYWNLVIHHDLNQLNTHNRQAGIQKELKEFQLMHGVPNKVVFDRLPSNLQLQLVERTKKVGARYVVGALYGDMEGSIYEFDKRTEYIKFNSSMYIFLQKYRQIVTHLTNYHLAKFLEKHNDKNKLEDVLLKVENISKRESLHAFYNILWKYETKECFYCGKVLSDKRIATHVDHFIPWSYIQSDNMWNLVLSCQSCNTKKSNKLAKSVYLEKMFVRNDNLKLTAVHNDFNYYSERKLEALYEFAGMNGYVENWAP